MATTPKIPKAPGVPVDLPIGELPQAAAKLSGTATPVPGAPSGPGNSAVAQPAPRLALPAPTITVNGAGEAMTNAQMQNRATLGNTPDVAAAARARLSGGAPVTPAPVSPSPLTNATTSPGAAAPSAVQRLSGAPPATPAGWTSAPGAQGPGMVNPDFGSRGARVAPAATPDWTMAGEPAPAAAPAAAARSGVLSRLTGLAGKAMPVLGKIGGAVGTLAAAGEGISAINSAGNGNYGDAAKSGGMAALDAAAVGTKSPVLATLAGVAHGTDALYHSNFGQHVMQWDADVLPGSGARQMNSTISDMQNITAARRAQGLPVGQADNRIEAAQNEQALHGGGVVVLDPRNRLSQGQGPDATGATQPPQVGGGGPGGPGTPPTQPPDRLVPDGPGAANSANWSHAAQAAMASSAPGTAVINGRVITPDEIKALENRNVISGDAFGVPGQPRAQDALAGNNGGGVFHLPTGYSGGIGGPPTDAQARTAATSGMMNDARDAIAHGRRRTAGALTSLINTTNQQQQAEMQHDVATRPRPLNPAEEQQMQAQASRQGADAQLANVETAQKMQIAQVQQLLAGTTDTNMRKQLENKLAALAGKPAPEAKDRLTRLKVPMGQGVNAREVELPYDAENNQLLYPQGLEEAMGLPEKKQKNPS